jgi:hydroxyacylglutathione hydrolase
MLENLGQLDSRLEGIIAIQGIGLSSNIYVINDGDITLVDTGVGDEYNRLDGVFKRLQLPIQDIRQVILTHAHPDHFGGLLTIRSPSPPRILVHKLDSDEFEGLDKNRLTWIGDGDVLTTNRCKLKVIHTPGHTAGSICLFDEINKILFSGDTVFPDGSFGRTDLPTGDSSALVNSLRRLTSLQVDSLLAGHERPIIRDASSHIRLSYQSAQTLFDTV